MARVLSSISVDSPVVAVSANVGDTFTFAGTPTLSGSGPAQRYDFKWEVNPGSGFVPISGATGLSTVDTNPLVNTNSSTQNAITVTCATAGSYTIRMAGAPTSGGSYTVLSATRSVTAAAAITGTLSASESGSDTFSATGTVSSSGITGALAANEAGADTFAASGNVPISGSLAAVDAGPDSFAATGSIGSSGIAGTLAAAESGADVFVASGLVLIRGGLSAVEIGADTFSALSGGSVAQCRAMKNQSVLRHQRGYRRLNRGRRR